MNMTIYTLDEHDPGHPSFEKFGPHCIRGSWGAKLRPDLAIAKGARFIRKGHRLDTDGFDAFEDDDLADLLRDHGIQDIVVMGVCLEYCVKATTLGALKNGFTPIVILDCCYPADPSTTYETLNVLMSNGAHVCHSGDIPPHIDLPYNTALMIIDVQNDFFYGTGPNQFRGALPIIGGEAIIPRINEVLQRHDS